MLVCRLALVDQCGDCADTGVFYVNCTSFLYWKIHHFCSFITKKLRIIKSDHGQFQQHLVVKMSLNSVNRPASTPRNNGILREVSLNVPETTQGTRTSTPSTLRNSSHHVRFDQEVMGRTNRTSLLALAYMPPDDSDDGDNAPVGGGAREIVERTMEEEEHHHDMNDLADYKGDSDDEGLDAGEVLVDVEDQVNQRGSDRAALLTDKGYASCDNLTTDTELLNEQDDPNAPLLLSGAPVGWRAPTAPEGWVVSKPKVSLGEPDAEFKDIDNPRNWSPFSFQPKFLYKNQKAVKYLYHAMPTGCTPVPEDDDGIRSSAGFQFYYNGWTRDASDPPFRCWIKTQRTSSSRLHYCRKVVY